MKYFGYYADIRKQNNVNCTLAAVNKMYYIASSMKNIDGEVEIVSAVSPLNGEQFSENYNLERGIRIRYFKASTGLNKIGNIVKRIFHKMRLFFWAYKNIKQNETVVIYHSLGYMNLFKLLKRIKNFSLILEVEEIYSDVLDNQRLRKKELQFVEIADAYIFPTKLLSDLVNRGRKPEVIVHGTYKVEPLEKKIRNVNINNKKNVLYAGTFDPRKGGAYAAINAVKYLPENYHMHILGFGTENDIYNIQQLVETVNSQSKARVSYDGLKSGEDYVRFVQSCDVGVSTQNPSASFNDTSFPSKILSYFSNGLKVVSVRIPVVETSKIGDIVFYYDKQEPREIATAIIEACESEESEDVRIRITRLDTEFCINLKMLIEKVKRV